MDALLKSLEKRGYEVRLSGKSTEVRLLDTVLSISISEQLVRERKEPKDPDFDGIHPGGDRKVGSSTLCSSCPNLKI